MYLTMKSGATVRYRITDFVQSLRLVDEMSLDASQIICPDLRIVVPIEVVDEANLQSYNCSLHMDDGTNLFEGVLDLESVEIDYTKDTLSFEIISDLKSIMQEKVFPDYVFIFGEYSFNEGTGEVNVANSRPSCFESIFRWLEVEIPRIYAIPFMSWDLVPWSAPYAKGKMFDYRLDAIGTGVCRLEVLKTYQILTDARVVYKPGLLRVVALRGGGSNWDCLDIALTKKDRGVVEEVESLDLGDGRVRYISFEEMHYDFNTKITTADREVTLYSGDQLNSEFDIRYNKLYYEGIIPNDVEIGDEFKGNCITKIERNTETIESGETYAKIEVVEFDDGGGFIC